MSNTIKKFIQEEVIRPRLAKAEVLVVYDPAHIYRDLCVELSSEDILVVDASESSILSREAAIKGLCEMGKSGSKKTMLIYIPTKQPLTDEEKQQDPFAIYGAIGSAFPQGDGDEYLNLCLKAKADHSTEIRKVFQDNPIPPFDVIDAIGKGPGWPHLQACLGMESAREIIITLLVPENKHLDSLKSSEAWVTEARSLFASALGLKLMTKGKSWNAISDELWRFLLFSEFAFDLPGALPDSLANIPFASIEAKPLIFDICDRLRDSDSNKSTYIDRAEAIEKDLNLVQICSGLEELGNRDTFPFEERSYLNQAVKALKTEDVDSLRNILNHSRDSVWSNRGENSAQWQLVRAAAALVQACDDAERQLPDHVKSQNDLLSYYVTSLREVDRLHREFEQAERDLPLKNEGLDEILPLARKSYRRVIDIVQANFMNHLEKSGWPPSGLLSNSDVFDKLIAPKLQESGRRIAVFQIDALRYELGVELEKQLANEAQVELLTAYAQLPSITPVGMSSLLPGAGSKLALKKKGSEMIVALGDQELPQVTQRMDVLRNIYGQRFSEMQLSDFIRKKKKVSDNTELLVLRSNTIDQHMESTSDVALQLIQDALKSIRIAVHILQTQGFKDAFIVTDHGFYLNTTATAGDVCQKPSGNWVNLHERMLLGDGHSDNANAVFSATHLGIRGDYAQVACPRSMVPYRAGMLYFHGGISLQEAVVPVIVLQLSADKEKEKSPTEVYLHYKNGTTKITSRIPMIHVVASGDLFNQTSSLEILLEAHDVKGKVVGEAKVGDRVNAATHTLSIKMGEDIAVPLKMDPDFEGKFIIKALNPATLFTYCKLELETDYTV